MAITAEQEIHDGAAATENTEFEKTAVRQFRIVCDAIHSPVWVRRNTTTIPGAFAAHPDDTTLRARSIEYRHDEVDKTRKVFVATVNYDNKVSSNEDDQEENPLNRRVKYWLEWANRVKIIDKDVQGKPIQNAAKRRFVPPFTDEDPHPVLVAVKNIASNQLSQIISQAIFFRNSINSGPFKGAPAKHARCDPIQTGQPISEGEYEYYAVQYRILFSDKPWQAELLNRGTTSLIFPAGGGLASGEQHWPHPVNLSAIGEVLDPDEEGNFLTFDYLVERDFNQLGI